MAQMRVKDQDLIVEQVVSKIEANELISNLPEDNNLKKLGEEIPFLELAQ